jgi:two-component system heavy metal sensor histidine kinase CusS
MMAFEGQERLALERLIPADGERPGVRLVLTRDDAPWARTLACFRDAVVAAGVVGLALIGLLGLCIARLGLAPLTRLSAQARALRPGDTAQRLGFLPLPRELEHLTGSFNGALGRLDTVCRQLEAFNANVAHELRTPLTNLIGQTQVTLMRAREPAVLEENLRSNLEEMERLRAIVHDMLFLARADQGVRASAPDAVFDLAAEARQVLEYFEPLLDEASMTGSVAGQAWASIDVALFRRALGNLVHNAIQHGCRGGRVLVCVGEDAGVPSVSVSNEGPAIDGAQLERLFDRFYRADPARRNPGGNHGLGLSIVKAIASMHRGTAFARSEGGVNTFGFTLRPVDAQA